MFIKNHKKICILLGVLLVVLIIAAYFLVPYIKRHYMTVSVNVAEVTEMEKVDTAGKKILTVYFTRVGNTNFDEDVDAVSSASLMKEDEKLIGNSQLLATMVQNSVGGELYAIQTEKKYPSAYGDTVSASKEEIDTDEEVPLSGKLPDVSTYDTIILAYPVWWGTIPNAVRTFLKSEDLTGKTIYPLITHGGSGAGSSVEDIKKVCKANVSDKMLEVFDDDVTAASGAVAEWLKSLWQ